MLSPHSSMILRCVSRSTATRRFLSRTVRGPSMSTTPGKVEIVGVSTINGERVIALRFLQARTPEWVMQPFFARYDAEATWLDELKPAFGAPHFFFEHAEPLRRRAV